MKAFLMGVMLWVDSFAATPRQTYVLHKTLHAIGGIGIYYAFDLVGYPKLGLSMALAVGIAKELLDQSNGGRFRAGDIAWTVLPATVVFVVRW